MSVGFWEDKTAWICELLDLLDGSDQLSRNESSAAPSGFGEPARRVGVCGACSGRGCARCVRGKVVYYERDDYDRNPRPVVSTDNTGDRGLLDSSELARVVELDNYLSHTPRRLDGVAAPTLPEHRNGNTPVERTVFLCLAVGEALDWLEDRLATAPEWIRHGARERDDEALRWLAKRAVESGVRQVHAGVAPRS